MKVPFAIYADFESLIRKLNKARELNTKIEKLTKKLNKTKEEVEKHESYTIKLQRHFPISFVIYIKYANWEIKQNLFEYFGLDAPKKLYEKLREDALFIAKEYLDKKIKMKELPVVQNNVTTGKRVTKRLVMPVTVICDASVSLISQAEWRKILPHSRNICGTFEEHLSRLKR